MEGFSFSNTAGTSQSTAQPKLAGNNIYDVLFDGCEIKDVAGVKDPNALYKQVIIKFKNEDGVFEHTVWEPKPDDFNRTETEYKDKEGKVNKIPQPSNVESMMLLFKHVIDAVNPTLANAIDKKEKNLAAANWDAMRDLMVKALNPTKGAKVKIKLLKNKNGDAIFPGFFASISKEGVAYIKNNFIGPKVAFSTYEVQRINNENNARPSSTSGLDFAPANAPAIKVRQIASDASNPILLAFMDYHPRMIISYLADYLRPFFPNLS